MGSTLCNVKYEHKNDCIFYHQITIGQKVTMKSITLLNKCIFLKNHRMFEKEVSRTLVQPGHHAWNICVVVPCDDSSPQIEKYYG